MKGYYYDLFSGAIYADAGGKNKLAQLTGDFTWIPPAYSEDQLRLMQMAAAPALVEALQMCREAVGLDPVVYGDRVDKAMRAAIAALATAGVREP